ncbi:helix-turn-helix transcriptional regulator [Streptomyces viridosporus]|uniref:helix-turn-helix transcriptional regulator n=1 Tax=Streptomyces viridosporus TaxID=67581 RepID=UPI0036F5E047
MSRYSSWAEAKRRIRENQPEVSDAEWESREQAARTATEAYAVGHRLREIREERGLAQARMAAVGVSRAGVSQIERGEIHDLETMRAYAEALGAGITVTIEYGDRTAGAVRPECRAAAAAPRARRTVRWVSACCAGGAARCCRLAPGSDGGDRAVAPAAEPLHPERPVVPPHRSGREQEVRPASPGRLAHDRLRVLHDGGAPIAAARNDRRFLSRHKAFPSPTARSRSSSTPRTWPAAPGRPCARTAWPDAPSRPPAGPPPAVRRRVPCAARPAAALPEVGTRGRPARGRYRLPAPGPMRVDCDPGRFSEWRASPWA